MTDATRPGAAVPAPPRPPGLVARVARSWTGGVGLALIGLVAASALLAPLLSPADPLAQQLSAGTIFQAPSAAHPFGTDNLGRDVLSRVLHGMRFSLGVALASVGIAVAIGLVAGTLAGTLGGWWDRALMRLVDSFLAFPVLILAIAISVALGRGAGGVILAIAFVNVPVFTRLARAQTLKIEQAQYMTAAVLMGSSLPTRILRHTLPNMLNPVLVQASVALSFAVLIESGLSFLGLGIPAPAPSLGLMIAEAKAYIALAPHMVAFPSLAIVVTVLGFNLLGDAAGDATDPRRRG